MNAQIETLRKMQEIEMEAGFPNGELYNELEDRISLILIKKEQKRKASNAIINHSNEEGLSHPMHY